MTQGLALGYHQFSSTIIKEERVTDHNTCDNIGICTIFSPLTTMITVNFIKP